MSSSLRNATPAPKRPAPRANVLLIVGALIALGVLATVIFAIIRQISKNRSDESSDSGSTTGSSTPDDPNTKPDGSPATKPDGNGKDPDPDSIPPRKDPKPIPPEVDWKWVPAIGANATIKSDYGTNGRVILNFKYDADWVDESSGVLILTLKIPAIEFNVLVKGRLNFPIAGVHPILARSLKNQSVKSSVAKSTTSTWYHLLSPAITYRLDPPPNQDAIDLALDLRLAHPNGVASLPAGDLSFIIENIQQ